MLRKVFVPGLLVSLAAAAAAAQVLDDPLSDEALLQDAASYAADHGVGLDEAAFRLGVQLHGGLGELEHRLAEGEPERFAGLWLEHEPEFRVVVRMTDLAAAPRVRALAGKGVLADLLEVRPAVHSLAGLEAAQAAAHHLAGQLGVTVESQIDVYGNRVELYAVEADLLQASLAQRGLRLPEGVAVVAVERLSSPDQVTLLGGRPLSTCTGAFTVRSSAGQHGLLTAAHCGNAQSFSGVSLPFRAEDQSGNQDVQWHSATCGMPVADDFDSGIGIRDVTGIQTRANQAIGSYVCKHGMTTGYTCGYIESKTYAPSYVSSAASTFVRVDGRTVNLSSPGDSGGPWFVETLAYGTHSGEPGSDGNDSIYMPVEYISSLFVTVLTAPPTAGALAASLSCSGNFAGSHQVSCNAVTTGGTPPHSYAWSYSGSAPSWSSGGAWAYAYYSGAGCGSGNVNFFWVTVTDACGGQAFASIGSLPCF